MTTVGFDQPLYVLPFDHRFRAAVATGVPKANAGILVDEQFGGAILRDVFERAHAADELHWTT